MNKKIDADLEKKNKVVVFSVTVTTIFTFIILITYTTIYT